MNTQLATEAAPDWFVAEMPPGYQNRVAEIQRLSVELRALEQCGRLLWSVGDALTDAVYHAFATLGFETQLIPGPPFASVQVTLEGRVRLLLHGSATKGVIQKNGVELAHVFQMLHERAEDTDRVVLVTNSDPRVRPAERTESIGPQALNLLQRLGANVLPGPTLFALWSQSVDAEDRARRYAERLHQQDGGTFVLPSIDPS